MFLVIFSLNGLSPMADREKNNMGEAIKYSF